MVRLDAEYQSELRLFGPFAESELLIEPDSERLEGESQVDYLLREYSIDFGCWFEEVFAAYREAEKIAEKNLRKVVKQEAKKKKKNIVIGKPKEGMNQVRGLNSAKFIADDFSQGKFNEE